MPRVNCSTSGVHTRLLHICDYFFNGDFAAFARVLGLRPHRFSEHIHKKQPSLDIVLRVAQNTNICVEWLLFGIEPIVRPLDVADTRADVKAFPLARHVSSTYPVFTEFLPVAPLALSPVRYPDAIVPSAAAVRAAEAVYTAQIAGRPVLLFADSVGARTCRKLIMRLLQQNSLAGLVYTGQALEEEMLTDATTVNVPTVLRVGAQAGIGFGEAAQRWGGITKRSPVRAAQRLGVPFAAHVSVGEMSADFSGFAGAADAGAALGACAYVDALVLADCVRRLLELGGVVLSLATASRTLDWLPVMCRRIVGNAAADFSVIFFGTRAADVTCDSLYLVGGTAHFLEGDLAHVAEEVRLACLKIFDGITDDDENDSTGS